MNHTIDNPVNAMQVEIEAAWEHRATLTPNSASPALTKVINTVIQQLEIGKLRVASPTSIPGQWQVHTWVKQALLLYFRLHNNQVISGGPTHYFDKVPLQYQDFTVEQFQQLAIRVVPPACVRRGAYVGPNSVLMPSYVNIGAYIGAKTMIDTWATIGSAAQIGRKVHISGGVGIGGVLEPLQAQPTIIEDDCFIGARSEIVEGVIVEQGAVIGMGVYIGQSTRIYDRARDQCYIGRVPAGSVVVPGALPGHNGKYQLNCAVIVKQVDAITRSKTSINELLRDID
jgi:2,3,4,5-tetrahydropyridine-2-carboxylate N-succinyltransferase